MDSNDSNNNGRVDRFVEIAVGGERVAAEINTVLFQSCAR